MVPMNNKYAAFCTAQVLACFVPCERKYLWLLFLEKLSSASNKKVGSERHVANRPTIFEI